MLNTLALEMEEFWEMFDKFSPLEMVRSRVTGAIRYDVSALENIALAILSDK